ncbi:MAG: RNA polymerase sigma factor [Chitinophagaceae bacterium]
MSEKEYNECVDQYADGLFRFIKKNLGHPEDARDLVQNSFEILWRHHLEIEVGKARSYLFTVGYRQMIDLLRKNKRISLVEDFPESYSFLPPQQMDIQAILQRGMERLSEVQKSLVLLKDYEGYSYEEMGKITGLTPTQVKVYLHRARLTLKQFLVQKENVI